MNKEQIELRGFLYADGSCMIIKQQRQRKYKNKVYHFVNYIPRINITQRNDNLKLLKYIQKNYGGYVYENKSLKKISREGYNSNPASYWRIQNFEDCKRVCNIMLDTEIPYSKKQAVKILKKFCDWRLSIGQRKFTKDEMQKIAKWHEEIKKANSYQE
jgi:hypothetical protein